MTLVIEIPSITVSRKYILLVHLPGKNKELLSKLLEVYGNTLESSEGNYIMDGMGMREMGWPTAKEDGG